MRHNGYSHRVGKVLGVLAIAAGAVMFWAAPASTLGFTLSTVIVALVVVGGACLLMTAMPARQLSRAPQPAVVPVAHARPAWPRDLGPRSIGPRR